MSLPTCPSCGQSVLEDNVVDCPFCGAAMDGSRGAKYTPRAKTNPGANRPGARKLPEKPASPAIPAASTEAPKPASRPASGARSGKSMVDEDDPFGIGNATAASQAVQATAKPEKGRLQKVVCPMCEQVGFIPKNAIGKSVRCANPECMVPVFIASDSNEQSAERKPARLSDEAEAARRAAQSARPAKRNPLVVYGIVGVVLLALTLGVLPMLTKQPDVSKFNNPVEIKEFGPDEDEIKRLEFERVAKAKAAADAANPLIEVEANAKRMIALARQPNLRNKAWARRMTGDIYQRLSNETLAAQEFNHLLVVDSNAGLYRIDPHLTRYWRSLAAGDTETTKKALADALADLPSLSKTPGTGRTATESAVGLAAALVNNGQAEQAAELIASRQLDRTIPDNRDAIARMAWGVVADRSRDTGLECPAVLDVFFWTDPLHTAVAMDLAIHDRWSESVEWAKSAKDNRTIADSLVAMIDVAAAKKAPAEVLTLIENSISASDIVGSLRVRATVAAVRKDTAGLDACLAMLEKLPVAEPASIPASNDMIQKDVPDRSSFLKQAVAVADLVRAFAAAGSNEQASVALNRLLSDLSAAAPPTAALRDLTNQMTNSEAAFRKRLGTELRVSIDSQLDSMFRTYRQHLEQLAAAAENRRLLEILLLARIVRAGGATVVQQAVNQSAELKQELLLDELSGLIAVSARKTGQDFPEFFAPDASLKNGRARYGNAQLIVGIAYVADQAWTNREQGFSECLVALESGAGTAFPGMRQALVCELVDSVAKTTPDPAIVLSAIAKMQNGVWREEAYVIAGEIFADRQMDRKAGSWMATAKMPSMEQITLLYGISLGLLERPVAKLESAIETTASARQE